MTENVIAKYLRLSSEDTDLCDGIKLESNSIANQRNLLNSFIRSRDDLSGAKVVEFCDDGWSGKNFERPAVKEMLEQVRQGKIQCIIVKDLSRFGRDYLTVGNYISRVFPFMGVRFIAVNDGFDSIRSMDADSLETSFKTLLYDLYSRDLSRKVCDALYFRAKRGDFLSPFAPYGFVKDPKRKNHLLVDPPAAAVVRRIFQMAGDGVGTAQIAKQLNQEAVLTPMLYKRAEGCKRTMWPCVNPENFWTSHSVTAILQNVRYLGTNVYRKSRREKIGSPHIVRSDKSDWIVAENTHEAIVTKEEFDRAAQNLRQSPARTLTFHHRPLDRKIRCGICGHAMSRLRNGQFFCQTAYYTDAHSCAENRIIEQDVLDALLISLHSLALMAVDAERVWEARRSESAKDTEALLSTYAGVKENLHRLEQELKELYELFAMGNISKQEYLRRKSDTVAERESLSAKAAELSAKIDNAGNDGKLNNRFVTAFRKLSEVTEITKEITTDVLKTVYIYPGGRISIVWNYLDDIEKISLDLHGEVENGP